MSAGRCGEGCPAPQPSVFMMSKPPAGGAGGSLRYPTRFTCQAPPFGSFPSGVGYFGYFLLALLLFILELQ